MGKYKLKKSKLTDAETLEKISKHLQEAAESPEPEASDDDDGAPEEVGFGASKDEALKELKEIKEKIKEVKETKKLKRKERQERNEKQKNEKLKDLDKLPDSILKNLSSYPKPEEQVEYPDLDEDLQDDEEVKSKKIKDKNISRVQIKDDSSFIPLTKKRKSNIKVVPLEVKKPNSTIPAVNFRDQMLNRKDINRQPASHLFSTLRKRWRR